MNNRKVLLTGASGQIGRFAIPHLLGAGFDVIAVSRSGRPPGYPVSERVEWLPVAAAKKVCGDCQYFLSAGPLELAKEFLIAGIRFRMAVIFSSSSVIFKCDSDNPAEKRQMLGMLELENELRSMVRSPTTGKTGLNLVILRPTLIYGCGLDTNISRLARWIRRYGFMPVNGRAQGLRQPVHADDLASVAVFALHAKTSLPETLPVAGGSTLSYSDMVVSLFTAIGKQPRILRLPQWLLVLLTRALQVVNPATGLNAEMVKRQCLDLVCDDHQARKLLNYKPRRFEPDEKDLSLPDFKNLFGS